MKTKATAKRGSARRARRSTRLAKRSAKRAASRRPGKKPTIRSLRSVAIAPGEASERPSVLEGLDVETSPPAEREGSDWDGLDVP